MTLLFYYYIIINVIFEGCCVGSQTINGECFKKGECVMSLEREFVSCVVKNLPELSDEDKKNWVSDPGGLQAALQLALVSPSQEGAKPILLKRVKAVRVAGAKRFVPKDELKSVNVGFTGGNFNNLFLNQVEEDVENATLVVHRLERVSLDAPILTELGDRAATKLCWLFDLLKKQSKGEKGVLLTNGYANIIYVRDANGMLWAVRAFWNSDCGYWDVYADPVEHSSAWRGGHQVLSRDS